MAARIMAWVFGFVSAAFSVWTYIQLAQAMRDDTLMERGRDIVECGILAFGTVVITCFFAAIAGIHMQLERLNRTLTQMFIQHRPL